ncbi:MAG: thiol-disulfide oxidoreductase [Thalassolituus sp.]|jgi:predicted DCC family thiol-disulfide oxidoreductase YuxK|uniref:thiol-disulfide oxidoreductase DCC family protein n=1 Tax=Thalassolituus sp. TaxID=2030822 RepID=UPI003513BAFB|nr:MAG: thiol-disulfide oxidoreductase [Thalassolituus sp.]TNC89054.1 MAG: thiol-disulfide oxidoreductase [Thalassolituus sp.]
MSELTLYYDGQCPLCVREMAHLRQADRDGRLTLVDIQQEGFAELYPHIDPQAARTILHANTEDGSLLLGLDVTYRAWSLVGKGFWIAPLRWPVIRWFADKAYLWFARNRYKVSGWLTGQERCDSCGPTGCDIPKKD